MLSTSIEKTVKFLRTQTKLMSTRSRTSLKFARLRHFKHVLSLLILPANLSDIKYTISAVDLIFDNCYITDRSNDWSLLLFKEVYHVRRCYPPLNHDARPSKELTITFR